MMGDLSKVKLTDGMKKHFLVNIEKLRNYMSRAESLIPAELIDFKSLLDQLLPLLPLKIDTINRFGLPFERLSINEKIIGRNKRLKTLADIRYPPREIAHTLDYNRANLKGQTFMYAGSMGSLCNSVEVQPEKGQLLTVSKWNMRQGEKIRLLVICHDAEMAIKNEREILEDYNNYIAWLESLDDNTADVIDAIYKFIVDAYSRQVSPTNRQGYIASALISDFFFTKTQTDAIYYPSVPNNGAAMNIVIKPDIVDTVFEIIEIEESLCLTRPAGRNQWMNHATGSAKSLNADGEIIWTDAIRPPGDNIFHQIAKEHNVEFN